MERVGFEENLQNLNNALEFCESIRLGKYIAESRFADYRERITQLIEIVRHRQRTRQILVAPQVLVTQQREYIAALMESVEFGNLLPYLQQCDPATIRPKLRQILNGPVLPSDEDANSNQARNIQFELYLAHQLWRAGLMPRLGEHPDLTCDIDGSVFLFECKRLFSNSTQALIKRIQHAGRQLHKDRAKQLPGACGIVAISLSTRLNPEYRAIQVANQPTARAALASWLNGQAHSVRDAWQLLAERKIAAGILFFASSPFIDLHNNRFDLGQHFTGYSFVPEESPYKKPVLKLVGAMEAIRY